MDLTTLSDEDFTNLRVAVAAEVARRESLAAIPGQIMDLANTFTAIGGDPAALKLPVAVPPAPDGPAPEPEPDPEPEAEPVEEVPPAE